MSAFVQELQLAAPLFAVVLLGYIIGRAKFWSKEASAALARFVFTIALPAMLFRLMSGLAALPPVDTRLLFVYFGGCLIVFVFARVLGRAVFRLDGVQQSVFALGGVFSNNVLLGVPLAEALLGAQAMPSVALVVIFNSLLLWTAVSISVEWARHGRLSLGGFGATARSVLTQPVVAAIVAGAGFGWLGGELPSLVDRPLALVGDAAVPLALIVIGMGLAEYGIRQDLPVGVTITVIKLIGQPLAVLALARLVDLPPTETSVAVLLASLSVGINVYLMAREFDAMEGAVATSMVLSTAAAALTMPLAMSLL